MVKIKMTESNFPNVNGPTVITKKIGSKEYFFIVRTHQGKEEYLSIGMDRQPKWVTNFNLASTYPDSGSAQAAYDLLMKYYKESNEKMISKVNEADAFSTYLQDVHATKEYQAYFKEFSKLGYVKLYTLKNGSEIEVSIQSNYFAKDDFHPEINYNVYKKTLTIQTSSYGSMDLSKYQTFINHVNDGHDAAKLLLKLVNDKNYWNAIPDISIYKENRLNMKKDVLIEKDIRIPRTNLVLDAGAAQEAYDMMMKNYKESSFNFIRFEKNIPYSMRYKECRIEGDVLYWVTQDSFDKFDLTHFIDALEDTAMTKAYVIVRDDSTYNFKRDLANGYGVMIDLTKDQYIIPGRNIKNSWITLDEAIVVKENLMIPGTNIMLEAGDRIKVVKERAEANLIPSEILKPGFDGQVVLWCVDRKDNIVKYIIYRDLDKFKVCNYDKFNPRFLNARDVTLDTDDIEVAIEMVKNSFNVNEIIRIDPVHKF